MPSKKIPTIIISDSEGHGAHYFNSYETAKGLLTVGNVKRFRLAFLGDAVDKGPQSLQIVNHLLQQESAILVAGNRDANKGRFLELFSTDFVEQFGTSYNHGPFWDNNPNLTPAKFLESEGISAGAYAELSFAKKQFTVLRWILAKTMGAPQALEYRRQELCELMQVNRDTLTTEELASLDMLAAKSFIEEITTPEQQAILKANFPDSIMTREIVAESRLSQYDSVMAPYKGQLLRYLLRSCLFHLDGENLYSHSLLNLATYDKPHNREAFTDWVDGINTSFQLSLSEYYSLAFNNIMQYGTTGLVDAEGIKPLPFVCASLPQNSDSTLLKEVVISLNTAMLPEQQFVDTANFLARINVKNHHYGHQPQAQKAPTCRTYHDNQSGVARLICYDTSWSQSVVETESGEPKVVTHQEPKPAGAIVYPSGELLLANGETYHADTSDARIGTLIHLTDAVGDVSPGVYRIAAKNIQNTNYLLSQQTAGPAFPGGPIVYKDALAGRDVQISCRQVRVLTTYPQVTGKRKADLFAEGNTTNIDVNSDSNTVNSTSSKGPGNS